MRIETITRTIYKFDELSDQAKRKAYELDDIEMDTWGDEYAATLKAFEDMFDIKVYRYSVDPYGATTYAFVTAGTATECPDGDPLRVARFIWNNYADGISKGKYYGMGKYIDRKYIHKFRYSNATHEMDNCPLTGFCADQDILAPVLDCLYYKRMFSSFDELIEACLESFFKAWECEIEYNYSFEHYADLAECNEWEYLETGERIA